MKTPSPEALTTLLQAWSRGDVAARDQLFGPLRGLKTLADHVSTDRRV